MIHKRLSTNNGKVIVTFEIPSMIWAERISLVGDFNDWDRESLPFRQNGQEKWQIEIELDAGREYRFRYLLDGDQWRNDWHADKSAPNPDGGCDSVVIAEVPPLPDLLILDVPRFLEEPALSAAGDMGHAHTL